MHCIMLPDARAMFSMLDVHTLRKISFCLRNKHENVLTNNETKKNNAVGLHLDETNVQACVSFSDKHVC